MIENTDDQHKIIATIIAEKIKKASSDITWTVPFTSTYVPFYDLKMKTKKVNPKSSEEEKKIKQRAEDYCIIFMTIVRQLNVHKIILSNDSDILTDLMLMQLGANITLSSRIKKWECAFSIGKDGISLITFYSKLKKYYPTILVIKDTKGNTFGGFVTEKWHPSKRFYGTGESFLFSCKKKNEVTVSRWNGANDMIMLSDYRKLAIGGGYF